MWSQLRWSRPVSRGFYLQHCAGNNFETLINGCFIGGGHVIDGCLRLLHRGCINTIIWFNWVGNVNWPL